MSVRPCTFNVTRRGTACRLGLALFLAIALARFAHGSNPSTQSEAAKSNGAAAAASNWPQWRGPLASGFAPAADPPTTWGEGKNVRWKVKLPGRGTSTPIVWGERIFLTSAIPVTPAAPAATPPPAVQEEPRGRRGRGGGGDMRVIEPTHPYKFVLLCLDRRTGQTRWERIAREQVPHEGHHKDHGFASSSPVTDGRHVYAYFGSRGLHCFDIDGNPKWQKDLGRMQTRNSFGEGSSPALHGDTIVVNWDHEGDDFIAAFDKTTGEQRWRQPRDEPQSWSTPLVVEQDGAAQVIIAATNRVRSYDLKTGKPLWEAPGLTANTIPSPVAGDGMAFATAGFRGSALQAIRLAGASGDLANTDAIVWSAKRATPYVSSPLLYGQRLYFFSSNNGILSCFDTATGKPIVQTQRIDDLEGVYASPVGAAGRVYLVGRNGTTVVIKHLESSDQIEVLATNVLDERIDASPALFGKSLFLRGHESLYCIGGE